MALSPNQTTCSIVGIGASAGGLDALRRLLGALPSKPPFAVVVVQHLDPSVRSQLAEIIDRACEMRVVRAKSGETVVAGTVYVIPEGREARLADGALRLKQRSKACSEPIDAFFTSLAARNQANGCGVVLSGNGSDGVLGLREIRGAGGMTFAQDPSTAEYPAMPSAAIDSGVCDFVGPPEQIARDLVSHVQHHAFGGASVDKRTTKAAVEREAKALARIVGLVRIDSGMDFSGYKPSTVNRRVGRRAMLKDADSLDGYLAMLEDQPEELSALVDDLLINVTQFFRDTDVFEALRTRIFPEMLKDKSDSDVVRLWVIGCSTGEEVYSVLIAALEACEATGVKPKITVFGTDASEAAVKRARAGVYPPSVCATISAERLARYFVRTEQGFEIDRALRDMCVFARQDVTKDTPFSRLDLVSLRNVLIYMDQPLQRQVLAVAHFGLAPDGFLLLGTSETPETEPRLFRPIDKQNHVYRRQDVASRLPVDVANSARASIGTLAAVTPAFALDNDALDPHATANEMALLIYAPPRVVVDVNGHILHFFGDTSPYLEHAAGKATLDVNEMAQPGLALELKEALDTAKTIDGRAVREATFVSAGSKVRVSIEVMPLPAPPGQTQLMVAFRDLSSTEAAPASPVTSEDLARLYESREQRVRGELGALRGRLRAIAEEKEQFNQSLRSANEEIRSSNEELQSINEELETAKEELQSANEELITVNDELRQSNRDMSLVNDDLTNFMSSIDVPVIMLDRSLRVRRFTPQAERIVRIENSDVGRLLEHLRLRVGVSDLPRIAGEVVESETAQQFEVQDEDDCWYTMNARPYRSAEGVVDGVVIAFADIDELKRNAERLGARARLSEALAAIDVDLASTLEIDEIMQRALDEGAKAVGSDAGTIEIREQGGWVVRYQCGFGPEEVGMRLSEADAPNATAAAQLGEPLVIADMTADSRVNVGFVKAHNLKSVLAVPLSVRGSVTGCLLFYHRQAAEGFTDDQVDFGRRLGTAVSLALENARLMEAERESTRRAETLNAINEAIRSVITPTELVKRLVGDVSKIAGADRCLVIETVGQEYTVMHVRGVRDDIVGQTHGIDFFPAFAAAARSRRPVLIGDAWNDPGTNKEFVVPYELRSFELLPLVVDGEASAILALVYDEPRAFGDKDREFAERLCSAMSVALKNARLYASEVRARQDAKRELETTTLLLQVADVLAAPTSLAVRMDSVAAVVSSALVHERVVFSLWDERRQTMRVIATHGGPPPAQAEFAWDALSDAIRETVYERHTVVIDYDRERLEVQDLSERAGFKLAIGVPMVFAERVVGVIVADRPAESVGFSEREIELLESIASELAAAVENDRLFEAQQVELARTTVLREVAAAAAGTTDLRELSEGVLAACRERLGATAGSVYVFDREAGALVATALFGFPSKITGQLERMELDEAGAGARSYMLDEVVTHDSPDLLSGIADRAKAAKATKSRWVSVPVRARGQVVGSLGLIFRERRAFSPDEIALYQALADQLGVGLDKARLFEAERARAERMALLREAAATASSSLNVREVAAYVTTSLLDLLGARQTQIRMLSADGRQLDSVAIAGTPEGYLESLGSIPVDSDIETARTFRSAKTATGEDVLALAISEESRRHAQEAGVRSYALVPLRTANAPIGVLYAAWEQPRTFAADEVSFMEALAGQFATGLQNAMLYEAERRSHARVEALHALTELAMSSLDLSESLDAAITYVHANLGVDVITFWMLGQDRKRLFPSAGVGFPREFYDQFAAGVGLDEPFVVAHAVNSGRPVLHGAGHIDEVPAPVRESYTRFGVDLEALLVLPVSGLAGIIGAATFAWSSPKSLDDDEVRFFASIANELAIAAENATLFDEVRESARLDEALNAIDANIHSTLDFNEIMTRSLSDGVEALGCDAGAVEMREGAGWLVRYQYGFETDPTGRVLADNEAPCATKTLATRAPFVVQDATCDDALNVGMVAEQELRSVLAVPLVVRDAVTGCLLFYMRDRVRAFRDVEIDFAVKLAASVSLATENAELFEQLDASRQQVTQTLESISDGFYALDRDWRFTFANAEAGRMIGAPHTELIGKTIGEVVGNPEVLKFQQESFGPAMHQGKLVEVERYFVQTGIWADVRVFPAANGVSVYGHDITERRVVEEALRQARNRADMMAALLDESSQPFGVGNLDGTMGLVNRAFERLTGYSAEELQTVSWASTLTPPEYLDMEAKKLGELTKSDEPVRYEKEYIRKDGTRVPIELLVHLARDESGAPLHYYSFATDLTERKARERLDAAFNAARTAIGGTLNYNEIMSAALALGAEALGVDSAVAFRREHRGWRAVHSLGMPKSMGAGPFPDSEALGPTVVADEQRPVAINEPGVEARLNQSLIKRYRIKSVLAAPLGVKGAEIGAVVFYHRKRQEVFTEAQIEFITRFARVVTLAIQNSMLYERERRIADTLQDALLTPPESIEGIETSYLYRAASDTANVGGDFYDVFALDARSCAIVVGDVAGKGIDAARLTSLMHDGIRAYAMETHDPVELLERLNRLVCAMTPPEQYATIFFGVLDTRHGRLRYCTAGHPSPAIVGESGASYLVSTRSPVMGAFPEAQFACLETVLRLGERLVLFTDGVTEARRGTQFLGDEGLLKLLVTMTRTPVEKFSQRLLDKVLKFADGHLRDDTVILSLERTQNTTAEK